MKSLMMVAAAALACVAFADAPEGGARPEGGRRGMMGPRDAGVMAMGDPVVRMVTNPKVAESLGLSDEQKAKLKAATDGGEANRANQAKIREATMRQVELMKADKVDEAAVMKAIDEVFELRKEAAKEQAKRVIAVKSVLTPEQVKKAHEEMQKVFAARGDRGPRRNGPRDTGKRPANGDQPGPKPEAK